MPKIYFSLRAVALVFATASFACTPMPPRNSGTIAGSGLVLSRAVLYQNGVAYFERTGTVEGDSFSVRIRADQVNDFLKSLTVIDASDGQAVSVSLPLDRSAAAHVMELAEQLKGNISLPEIIALLKGTSVSLDGEKGGTISGRLLAVEPRQEGDSEDYIISVLGENEVHKISLGDLRSLTIHDEFITLGLHKGLDAAATGGVFKVVDVAVHLDSPKRHQILVSYVVECPAWKPTYRLVMGESDDVLLQGWAVVDNVTGEAWREISLSLTSGAPLAFRYDLYSPKFVGRPDLSDVSNRKVARAAVGEAAYGTAYDEEEAEMAADEAPAEMLYEDKEAEKASAPMKKARASRMRRSSAMPTPAPASGAGMRSAPEPKPSISMASLQQSVQSMVKASSAAGAVRYDMTTPVSVPDRSSTLVSILNHKVGGEEAYLFKPNGGAGQGYEQNPYRVVRFKNSTGFILEPGPISIYAGGSFVGEGIAETISDGEQATIPFAVDASILVNTTRSNLREGARLLRIFNGQIYVESFERIKTTYSVKGGDPNGYRLYIRHGKAGGNYTFKDMPEGTEDLGDAYLVPITVAPKANATAYTVIEQTPVTRTLGIWDGDARSAVSLLLENPDALPSETKAALQRALKMTEEVAKIDISISHLERRRREIDQRQEQTRENLKALKKNKAAGALKAKLAKSLSEMADAGDKVTKEIVSLTDKRAALAIAVEQTIGEISLDNVD